MFNKIKELMGLEPAEVFDDEDYGPESEPLHSSTSKASSTTYAPRVDEQPLGRPRNDYADLESPTGFTATPNTFNPTTTMNTPGNNVVGMPGNRWWGAVAEVVVMEPRSFDEMPQVIQSLKDRKSVVLNLTMMDAEEAQRAVDFVAGATFTIDGHQERIGESIFLFTPSCVQVSTQAGVVREVPQPQVHPMATPAPAWNTAAAM